MTCVDPTHFALVDGVISPQPWMQFRHVASTAALSKSGTYGVAGGGNKNDLLHSIRAAWENDTPIPQWCYGLVTRGGARVTLQARSRAYLVQFHGYEVNSEPGVFPVSQFGTGADIGVSGLLSIGTGFCVVENRQTSVTMPLFPQIAGWTRLEPGDEFIGRVDLRFMSEFWENTAIDGGDQGTESSYVSGDTRLDLFAVPIIE